MLLSVTGRGVSSHHMHGPNPNPVRAHAPRINQSTNSFLPWYEHATHGSASRARSRLASAAGVPPTRRWCAGAQKLPPYREKPPTRRGCASAKMAASLGGSRLMLLSRPAVPSEVGRHTRNIGIPPYLDRHIGRPLLLCFHWNSTGKKIATTTQSTSRGCSTCEGCCQNRQFYFRLTFSSQAPQELKSIFRG